MSVTDVSSLSQLGAKVDTPESPEKAVLEKVPNGNAGTDYVVRFTAPEFTSLCPMTGQPDFAHIVIDYIPGDFLVESKSLKLFLQSFKPLQRSRPGGNQPFSVALLTKTNAIAERVGDLHHVTPGFALYTRLHEGVLLRCQFLLKGVHTLHRDKHI